MNTNSATNQQLKKKLRKRGPRRIKERNIPNAGMRATSGSRLRRVGKRLKAPNLDSLVGNHSSYYKTLEDPFKYSGVKIPDDSTFPTSTFSIVGKCQLTAIAAGAPATGNVLGIMIDGYQGAGCLKSVTAYTGLVTTWSAFNPWGVGADPNRGPLDQWAQVATVYQEVRIVSAGIVAKGSMASLNDQGTLLACSIPSQARDYNAGTVYGGTYAQMADAFTCLQSPVKDGGACVCYRPTDPSSFEYSDSLKVLPSGLVNYYGGAFIFISGLATGATMDFTIIVNYEGIPRLSAVSLVSPTPSLRDSIEMDHAINKANDTPNVEVGPEAMSKGNSVSKAGTAGLAHHVSKGGGSFFGKVLGELGGFVKNNIPSIVETVGSLAL